MAVKGYSSQLPPSWSDGRGERVKRHSQSSHSSCRAPTAFPPLLCSPVSTVPPPLAFPANSF
ncbi:hypothetical protein BCV69DRAFT_283178 [Microstroma glucosiphilum]|uniref:Uncharacterized protein n=1 Tax=Pseudomicrostroma glucosiphilum TaxID=1684307 RepID=A0A316U4X4_9BASI|nr:hypothetical protein BCV69DRAFT_283178 [Pseudomicrostroma glucosiphilum]PWN20302.1 hypothetical protein BCV69DRAFT_283178 [Pseudomicrostroma glucosiphilum]